MDTKAIAESLRALAKNDKQRSKSARLREVFVDVEAALTAGVPIALVVQELAAHDLEMTVGSFKNALRKMRKMRDKSPNTLVETPSQVQARPDQPNATQHPVSTENDPESSGVASHDPADLDKIIGSKPDLTALAKLAKRR